MRKLTRLRPSPRTRCSRSSRRRALGLLAATLLSCFAPAPVLASFNFRASFVADKVVRLWFNRQDGIQVWNILEKLSTKRCRQLWQKVHDHPYVWEVREGLHGPRQLQLYHGLKMTFADHMRYG